MSEETSVPSTETVEATTEATTIENGETVSETSYLDGKYKSVSDLESGYKELQSTFSKKTAEYNENLGAFTGAPEGEYEFAEGIEISEGLQQYARDNQFSNDALNGLAQAWQNEQTEAQNAHIAREKELLGKDADTRINNLKDWARGNYGEESVATLEASLLSADAVALFEQMMKSTQGVSPTTAPAAPKAVDADTIRQMQMATDEYGNRKMQDPQYAAKVRALREQIG